MKRLNGRSELKTLLAPATDDLIMGVLLKKTYTVQGCTRQASE